MGSIKYQSELAARTCLIDGNPKRKQTCSLAQINCVAIVCSISNVSTHMVSNCKNNTIRVKHTISDW